MQKKFVLSMMLTLVLSLFIAAGTAAAAPTPFQSPMWLDRLINGGMQYQIDDKVFYGFSYAGGADRGATAVTSSQILVTPLTTPFNPGLQFTAPLPAGGTRWSVTSGQYLDSGIGYTVQVLPGGNAIKDISLSINGGNPGVLPTLAAYTLVTETASVLPNTTLAVGQNASGEIPYNMVLINQTMGPITVYKDIQLSGDGEVGGTAQLMSVENRFSEVPIPPTAILLGAGLMGIGIVRKRIK